MEQVSGREQAESESKAANLLMVARGDTFGLTRLNPTIVGAYIAFYLVLSLYFLMHAVNALKPRSRQMGLTKKATSRGARLGCDSWTTS